MKGKGKCVSSGTSIGRWSASRKHSTIWWPENIRGLVRLDDLVVPHSELAMHVGAAGKPILAWTCSGQSCAVVYADGEGCGFVDGLQGEVLHGAVARQSGFKGLGGRRPRKRNRRR